MNTQDPFCYLSQFNLFEELPEEEVKSVEMAHGKTFQKGEVIYSPHKENQMIYMLEKGEVMLYHSHEGRQETFDLIGPGTLFGNFNPDQEMPTHYAEATRESKVCSFHVSSFLKVVQQNPETTLRFITDMARRIQDYERRFKNNLQSAKEKIYEELLRLQSKRRSGFLGKFFGNDGPPLRLTHEKIASLTGLNRVTVTRSLKELKEDGLVSIHPTSGAIELHEKT